MEYLEEINNSITDPDAPKRIIIVQGVPSDQIAKVADEVKNQVGQTMTHTRGSNPNNRAFFPEFNTPTNPTDPSGQLFIVCECKINIIELPGQDNSLRSLLAANTIGRGVKEFIPSMTRRGATFAIIAEDREYHSSISRYLNSSSVSVHSFSPNT